MCLCAVASRGPVPREVAAARCQPWLARDRFRTMINVLGDALAAGIMAHICRKDFAQDMGTEVRAVSIQEASKTVGSQPVSGDPFEV